MDPTLFSGISARKCGLPTAIGAGVPEWALFFQSGHGQSKAARAYMAPDRPTFLFGLLPALSPATSRLAARRLRSPVHSLHSLTNRFRCGRHGGCPPHNFLLPCLQLPAQLITRCRKRYTGACGSWRGYCRPHTPGRACAPAHPTRINSLFPVSRPPL